MGRLLKTAFRERKHRVLLFLTLISMCLLTVATQMEIFAIGVITRKGPDFFEVVAPVIDGKRAGVITKAEFEESWKELDVNQTGQITPEDVTHYIEVKKGGDLIGRAIDRMNRIFPISNDLKHLAIFLIFVALFKAGTLFTQRYSTRLIAIRVSKDLRQEYFEHIQSLPMSFYQQHNIAGLSSRVVGDASLIAESINACLMNYIQTPFTILTTLTLCFLTSWQLSLMIFMGCPLIVFPIVFLARRVKRISKQIQHNQEFFASALIDFLAGIQTVKVFAMEDFSLKKYQERNERMAALEQKSARYDLSSRPIVHTIGMAFLAMALMYGLYILHMSVSDVLVYSGLLYLFYEPVKKFAEENSHIQRGISAAERMYEVMNMKPQIEDHASAVSLTEFNDKIEFEKVWFRYDDNWALKGVSFTVRKGETVAIVGPTGAGKSTIVQLLPRLYEIQEGQIRIDGKSIQSYTQKSLRETIAFVPQKPFLFLDTVSQNIAFGRPFTEEQVQAAAQKAHAEEFILRMPQGYKSELSEGGKNLSGGQQQRLAIARALVKNAPILIMDEATSSLDTVSEYHIKAAIQRLRGEVTQIIIAHRLSTIEDADKIIYLEKGEKVAEGTRDELLQICPGFRLMWEMMHKTQSQVN
jgi:ABC-type multidrug transport system fused ATPase/permease subunit